MAGRPDVSTWLSANAGSGKTRVLTDRVARLLLAGVAPEKILCLTYTKAAASEMQNRLFGRLGKWTMMPADALRKELATLGEENRFTDTEINVARTLFAQAIEAPGGLKIQTIHSFCSSVLRQFPLEAGISPQFQEMDEAGQGAVFKAVLDQMAEDDPTFDAILPFVAETSLDGLLNDILSNAGPIAAAGNGSGILGDFGLNTNFQESDILAMCFGPGDTDRLRSLREIMRTAEKATDLKNAKILDGLNLDQPGLDTLRALEKVFLVQKDGSPKLGKVPTKDLQKQLTFQPELDGFMERVAMARQSRLAWMSAQRSLALLAFGQRFLARYDQAKRARGLLDFDDLIQKTKALFSQKSVAGWVLFKLDGGIDHILVDEAQDTSPDQWTIIDLLTEEFTSGQGARDDQDRTIFVVGDKKQSIYSFQGADPRGFDRMRDRFRNKIETLGKDFQSTDLSYSFRSSEAILRFTDTVFDQDDNGLLENPDHIAFKETMPGRVDVWPSFEALDAPDPLPWTSPVDEVSPDHPDKRLADAIAAEILRLIQSETETLSAPDENGVLRKRAITAGDFLILVRGRKGRIYRELHRACKAAKLPLAGADRMVITDELAVKDVLSLLRFLATPEDSLALAEALKSPLFGWDDAQLYELAQGRSAKYLWREMERRAADFPDTHAPLRRLRDMSDFERPFELIQHILVRLEGRKKLVARLGLEADEALDALLHQAAQYENAHVPNLTDFLVWIDTLSPEVKRQLESGQNQVRIMTIHGAKGLEAPIVILPDTAKKRESLQTQVVTVGDTIHWMPKADDVPDVLAKAKRNALDHEALENDRLLYVALTRAESWLIVAASNVDKEKDDRGWYKILSATAESLGAQEIKTPNGPGLRFETGDWSAGQVSVHPRSSDQGVACRNGFPDVTDAVFKPRKAISPSDLGGAKALPGEMGSTEYDPKVFGSLVHWLLETLPSAPKDRWRDIALTQDSDLGADALQEAVAVLENPAFVHIFHPDTLAEVPLSATLPVLDNALVQGSVDRLIVGDDRVLAVDFKTNRSVPDTPDATPLGILRQMGAYAAALALIFPNHDIDTAILWTKTQDLMPLPHHIVMQALQSAAKS